MKKTKGAAAPQARPKPIDAQPKEERRKVRADAVQLAMRLRAENTRQRDWLVRLVDSDIDIEVTHPKGLCAATPSALDGKCPACMWLHTAVAVRRALGLPMPDGLPTLRLCGAHIRDGEKTDELGHLVCPAAPAPVESEKEKKP